jgi:glycosyltransferase involved in cell wall biosynthesis
MRIVTNTRWFDGRAVDGGPVEIRRISGSALSGGIRKFLRLRHWDAAVLNVAPNDVLALCLLKRLFPSSRLKIIAVDLILPPPRNLAQRLRIKLIGWLFRAVDLFIFYSKDTSGLQAVYGLPAERIRYVPFKVNDFNTVLNTPTSDAGYILSCGRSYRDYATFCKALEGLPYSARIVATLDQLRDNGTEFDLRSVPTNVSVVAHDGASDSWIDWIARSRVVVLPISADALVPAGISACLVAMALGKCVVVSDSPVTRGILKDGEHAVVVPASDPVAMRAAIVRVCEDADYRAQVARTGREYALSLRDESRLGEDVVRETIKAVAK